MATEAARSRVQSRPAQIGMTAEAALSGYSHPAQFVCSQSCIEQGAVKACTVFMAAGAALVGCSQGDCTVFMAAGAALVGCSQGDCTVFMAAEAAFGKTRYSKLTIYLFLDAKNPDVNNFKIKAQNQPRENSRNKNV